MTTPRTLEEAVEVCAKATFPDMTPSERLAFQAGFNAALESVREEREAAWALANRVENYWITGTMPKDIKHNITHYRAAKDSR